MRGTSRPSDATRSAHDRGFDDVPKHGDRLGNLVIEGVPFQDANRKMRVHARCVVHGTPVTKVVYHLVHSVNPGCPQCRGGKWNRTPACPKKLKP